MGKGDAGKLLQWHMGALSVVEIDLKDYWEYLKFTRDFTLNTKPLEIDMLIIKKDRPVVIDNEIGRIFRQHNIVEYKSEEDALNMSTLLKVEAYACLYQNYETASDRRPYNEITMTLIRESKPVGLFKELQEFGFQVTEEYGGVYYVKGALSFPTQIIVGRELDREKHKWYGMATGKVSEEAMRDAILYASKVEDKRERDLLDSIMDLGMNANKEVVATLKRRNDMYDILRDLFEPEIEEAKRETAQRVERETAQRVERETAQRVERETAQRVERETAQRVERETAQRVEREAREAHIRLAVKSLRRFHASNDDIAATLTEDYGLSEKEALSYLT